MTLLLLPFVAIDEKNTRLREDAFWVNVSGDTFTLAIASPLPSQHYNPAQLKSALEEHRTMVGKREQKIPFLDLFEKQQTSLCTHKARKSVVVIYQRTKGGQPSFDIEIARVKIEKTFTHEEYKEEERKEQDSFVLATMLQEIDMPKHHVRRILGDVEHRNESGAFIRGSLFLFNAACREYAQKISAPFVGYRQSEQQKMYWYLSMEAVFNRHLRDPLAFVNMTNLVSVMKRRSPPFSNEWIDAVLFT